MERNPMIERPSAEEMNEYFGGYVALVDGEDALSVLRRQGAEIETFFASLEPDELGYRYEEGKWSLKEVLGHLMDAERVFLTRALAFSRQDSAEMPGFDENDYVREAGFDSRSIENLLAEFRGLRASTLAFFEGLSSEQQRREGVANGSRCSVRAFAWILAGHERHHIQIAGERYLHAGEGEA
jgi:uncharacterized damage-inducible protein DinB